VRGRIETEELVRVGTLFGIGITIDISWIFISRSSRGRWPIRRDRCTEPT